MANSLTDEFKQKLNLKNPNDNPDLAIILGSGLKCELPLMNCQEISYTEIEAFPEATVKGHEGKFLLGEMGDGQKGKKLKILIFQGRFHLYEGFSVAEVQTIIRLIADLNIPNLLITNAAGGISDDLNITDLMVIDKIKDYQNDGELVSERGLLNCLMKEPLPVKTDLTDILIGNGYKKGIYVAVLGPNYETKSEINLFKNQGCSAVGMSTYLELKLALEKKINVAAVSAITNSWNSDEEPTHEEVLRNSRATQGKLNELFLYVVNQLK